MNSITYQSGKREYFPDYSKFSEMHDALKEAGCNFCSYYDAKGDTHLVQYKKVPDGVEAMGIHYVINDTRKIDRWTIHDIACKMVKEERYDEFLGWSL